MSIELVIFFQSLGALFMMTMSMFSLMTVRNIREYSVNELLKNKIIYVKDIISNNFS